MEVLKQFKFLLICGVVLLMLAQRNAANEIEFNEGQKVELKCSEADEGIRVSKGVWQYKKIDIGNMFTPNWRNMFYLWGSYVSICKYDVTEKISKECDGKNICSFSATKQFFDADCGYTMFLNINYECIQFCEGVSTLRPKRSTPSPMQRVCVGSNGLRFQQIVDALEGRYGSRAPTDMGPSITRITTRNVRNFNGEHVTLVYVMHARISAQTIQSRESMPRGVERRMRELSALANDDRGHLLASTLGGPSHVLNIAPQYCELNRVAYKNGHSWWRRLETNIRQKIDSNLVAYVDWTIIVRYNDPEVTFNFRPVGFALRVITHYVNGATDEDISGSEFSSNEIYLPNDVECGAIDLFPGDWFAS